MLPVFFVISKTNQYLCIMSESVPEGVLGRAQICGKPPKQELFNPPFCRRIAEKWREYSP